MPPHLGRLSSGDAGTAHDQFGENPCQGFGLAYLTKTSKVLPNPERMLVQRLLFDPRCPDRLKVTLPFGGYACSFQRADMSGRRRVSGVGVRHCCLAKSPLTFAKWRNNSCYATAAIRDPVTRTAIGQPGEFTRASRRWAQGWIVEMPKLLSLRYREERAMPSVAAA